MAWLLAFLFTQVIEVPIYKLGLRARLIEAFGASAVTHPIVWFVIPPVFDRLYFAHLARSPSLSMSAMTRYWVMVALAETFAVVVEALYFRALGREKPLRWALVANLASVTLGLLCRTLFGVR